MWSPIETHRNPLATRQPLTLAAGRHSIELQAPGYEPVAFDVDVAPGQVIPYQGALPPGY